jgi:hypothetical protein
VVESFKQTIFEVKSIFRMLSSSGTDTSSFPWRSIWKVKVSLQVSFFVWTATFGKILTLNNLRKSGESINHLLLHYEVARALWSVLFSLFNVTWVMLEGRQTC